MKNNVIHSTDLVGQQRGTMDIPIGKSKWSIMPNARVLKSSVGGSGYQVMGGVLIGWGW